MVPGLDLGDSASFQTAVGSLTLTPRQAYPLYHGLGNVFVWLHPGEPARAMNFASAVYGATAAGLAALAAARLTESAVGGIAAGLFLAFSYTFWSQAVTAEVYTLHLLVVGAALLALLSWSDRPTIVSLGLFYAFYSVGFGNHLSMILLLPAFVTFLLLSRRSGAADPLRLRTMGLAASMAIAGALQYAWNFRGLWAEADPPESLPDAAAKFWFDVTKADWRESLVMQVSEAGLESRPAMYWFDITQQFGVPGILLAVIGITYLTLRWPRRALLVGLMYAANLAFAWTYNVGDPYIFFLPAHYVVALCAGGGIAAITAGLSRMSNSTIATAAGILCLAYPAWRGYDTFPAVDRSWDTRAVKLLTDFTMPPPSATTSSPKAAIYGSDSNWQVQNAIDYFMQHHRPGIPWFVTDELSWLESSEVTETFNTFIRANHEIGREVLAGPGVLQALHSLGYQGRAEELRETDPFASRVSAVREGTPYALAILRPDREYPIDGVMLGAAWSRLTGGSAPLPDLRHFTIVVGTAGRGPALVMSEDRPYRTRVTVDAFSFDVRMESWLPTDTIRRAGFGHVIVDGTHLLTLERGISFAAIGPGGEPTYSSGLFAAIPRLRLGLRGQQ